MRALRALKLTTAVAKAGLPRIVWSVERDEAAAKRASKESMGGKALQNSHPKKYGKGSDYLRQSFHICVCRGVSVDPVCVWEGMLAVHTQIS